MTADGPQTATGRALLGEIPPLSMFPTTDRRNRAVLAERIVAIEQEARADARVRAALSWLDAIVEDCEREDIVHAVVTSQRAMELRRDLLDAPDAGMAVTSPHAPVTPAAWTEDWSDPVMDYNAFSGPRAPSDGPEATTGHPRPSPRPVGNTSLGAPDSQSEDLLAALAERNIYSRGDLNRSYPVPAANPPDVLAVAKTIFGAVDYDALVDAVRLAGTEPEPEGSAE